MFRFVLLAVAILLLIPPVVFGVVALAEGLGPAETARAIVAQYAEPKQNLFVCGAISIAPLLALLFVLFLYRRFGRATPERSTRMAWGGFVPIVLVQLWVNFEFWPDFLPDRVYPGFPHGLEFIIGPGLYAPAGMLIGLLVTWITQRGRSRSEAVS